MNPKYMPRRLDCDSISARCTHHCDTQISTISNRLIQFLLDKYTYKWLLMVQFAENPINMHYYQQ